MAAIDLSKVPVEDLARELRTRTAPDEALDAAYDLPEWMDDSRLRSLYEILLVRMHHESEHLPMNTTQRLIIERICWNFVLMKYREAKPLGDDQGFAHAAVVKEFNAFWLGMTKQFNDMLLAVRPTDKDMVRKAVGEAVSGTLRDAVTQGVIDVKQAQWFPPRLAESLDAARL